MRSIILTGLFVLLVCGCAGGPPSTDVASSGVWPQWRGPDRSGVSDETGLLATWPDTGPPLLWKAGNLDGYSSVAVARDRIYTMTDRDDAQWVVAIDVADGTEAWVRRIGESYENRFGDGPRATPTLSGDRLFTLGAHGDLWALRLRDGEELWHINVLERFGTENIEWGMSESPLVDGDRVIVATGSADGSIVAFHRDNGAVVWQSVGLTDSPGYASALLEQVGGVRQILHFTAEAAVGVRAEDGEPMWRYERVANDTANIATPVFDNGRVFYTSGYDTGAALLALTSDGTRSMAEEVYFTRNMMNHHGGVVLVDGYIYGFSNKTLNCIDFETGEKMWSSRSVGKGSLTAADGMLYVLGEKGILALVKASPEKYELVSRFIIGRGKRKAWAHPVIADGRLYVRSADDLRCYDIRAQG